ncbi:MAG: hypothetical protein ACK46A_01175 [Akkermansiaceae bacterium]|jgi:hypothetical protein|nr:hypothetical protein [Luteolibacter sp.]
MNQSFKYQRLVLGYHGCEHALAEEVLAGTARLIKKENDYDWLGSGIYFWEYGPERAMDWAIEQVMRKKIKNPAVVGAVIHLGQCFDMMDLSSTTVLSKAYPRFKETYAEIGKSMPENLPVKEGDTDLLLRNLDCSMINWLTNEFDLDSDSPTYDSVRGLFQESEPAFEGSSIRMKSHIQLSIRNPACILGYFRPAY